MEEAHNVGEPGTHIAQGTQGSPKISDEMKGDNMRQSLKNVLTAGVFALAVIAAAGCSTTGVAGIGSTDASQIDSKATLTASEQADFLEMETARPGGDL